MLWENTWQDYTLSDNKPARLLSKNKKASLFNGMLFLFYIGLFCKILRTVSIAIKEPFRRPKASLAGAEV